MARGRGPAQCSERIYLPCAYFFHLLHPCDDGDAMFIGAFGVSGNFRCRRLAGVVVFGILGDPTLFSMVCLSAGPLARQKDGNRCPCLVDDCLAFAGHSVCGMWHVAKSLAALTAR